MAASLLTIPVRTVTGAIETLAALVEDTCDAFLSIPISKLFLLSSDDRFTLYEHNDTIKRLVKLEHTIRIPRMMIKESKAEKAYGLENLRLLQMTGRSAFHIIFHLFAGKGKAGFQRSLKRKGRAAANEARRAAAVANATATAQRFRQQQQRLGSMLALRRLGRVNRHQDSVCLQESVRVRLEKVTDKFNSTQKAVESHLERIQDAAKALKEDVEFDSDFEAFDLKH